MLLKKSLESLCVKEIIDDIENRIRTQLAYYSGHKYGPLGYKEKENYNANHNHDKFMKNIEACIKENKKINRKLLLR